MLELVDVLLEREELRSTVRTHVKLVLRERQQLAVHVRSRPTHLRNGVSVVPDEVTRQAFGQTLVKQNGARARKGFFGLFESGHCQLPAHGWKIFEKLRERVSSLEIVEEGLKWDVRCQRDTGVPPMMCGSLSTTEDMVGMAGFLWPEYTPQLLESHHQRPTSIRDIPPSESARSRTEIGSARRRLGLLRTMLKCGCAFYRRLRMSVRTQGLAAEDGTTLIHQRNAIQHIDIQEEMSRRLGFDVLDQSRRDDTIRRPGSPGRPSSSAVAMVNRSPPGRLFGEQITSSATRSVSNVSPGARFSTAWICGGIAIISPFGVHDGFHAVLTSRSAVRQNLKFPAQAAQDVTSRCCPFSCPFGAPTRGSSAPQTKASSRCSVFLCSVFLLTFYMSRRMLI